MNILFLDIETTGFSRQWDFIIEIAAVLYNTESGVREEIFHEYIKPGKTIPAKITKLTGISNQQVRDCRDEDDVLRDFVEILAMTDFDALGGHNIKSFDVPFIGERMARYFFEMPKYELIDTLPIAKKIGAPTSMLTATGRPSYRMVSIAEGYGIKYNAHSAIADVMANIDIYIEMVKDDTVEAKRNSLGF